MNDKTFVRIPRALALQAAEQRRTDREMVERHLVSDPVETSLFSEEVRTATRLRRVGSARHLVGVRYG
jgi:hypothetical protein